MNAAGRGDESDWRPTASREMLQLRAALLARARGFFAARGVLEVDTPIVVNAPVTDVHIHSAQVMLEAADPRDTTRRPYFLHTSPEYAMKRLLAAGAGDIYQICHVVRALERGRLHNAEFTLIEWYRLGLSLDALMSEVEALVRELLGRPRAYPAAERVSYREAFLHALALDPFTAPLAQLAEHARRAGFDGAATDRDELLELLMGTVVGPQLGQGGLTFVHALSREPGGACPARSQLTRAPRSVSSSIATASSSPTAFMSSLPRASSASASSTISRSGAGWACPSPPWTSVCSRRWKPASRTAAASRSASTAR